jgi:hypothetical protein
LSVPGLNSNEANIRTRRVFDAAELFVSARGERIVVIPLADMGGDGERAAAERLHLAGDGFAGIELAAGDDDIGASLRERQHHLAAEPARAARHQCDLVGEIQHVGIISSEPQNIDR